MNKWFQYDEHTEAVSRKLATVFLVLTQIGLYLALIYQRYVQGLPPAYYNDLAILFALSALGYLGANLYLGGILPVLSFGKYVLVYLVFVASIAIPHTLVHGLPLDSGEWLHRLSITLGGPAILVGGYALMAYLGKKRLEKILSKEA